MKKIKITLTNGNIIEKPVLSAFKGTYGDYVVLDNESVGSMGLPVILISKIQDNKLSTIIDANEWNTIKDNLRNIIAGNPIIKTNVMDEYTGDEIYYKQLTLPVTSFDALKKAYDEGDVSTANAQNPAPVTDTPVNPAMPGVSPAPTIEPTSAPAPNAYVANGNSVMPNNVNPESVSAEQVEHVSAQPIPNVSSVGPMVSEANSTTAAQSVPPVTSVESAAPAPTPAPEAPEMPIPPMNEMAQEAPEPVVEPIPSSTENSSEPIDVAADKEAFLKACENMFDALVAKFNK